MELIVVDIRIGTPGPKTLSDRQMKFQNDVVHMILGRSDLTRSAHFHSFAFSYGQLDGNAAYIEDILNSACGSLRTDGQERALLVDLTESPPDLIREPVLLHLASKVTSLLKTRMFVQAILLLPFSTRPLEDSLLFARLKEIKTAAPGREVYVVYKDGTCQRLPGGSLTVPGYEELLRDLQADPISQIDRKMVRRLGKFPGSSGEQKTRVFSYLIDNCDNELFELMKQWYDHKHIECDAILYDTGNMPSMTEAVRAFAEHKRIPYLRIRTILSDPGGLDCVKGTKRCLIVLDVIETGNTLLQFESLLTSHGCLLCNDVISVLSKGGGLVQRVGKFTVSSFKNVLPDPDFPIEIQDSLRLPNTSHSEESYEQLRAFDMWYMAYMAGWEREPDVPSTGYAYKAVPNFPKMMDMFGDWIAYKMEKALERKRIPEDIFIIHPKENSSDAVSDKLRTRLDPRLLIVRVPREHIQAAQEAGNKWDDVLVSLSDRDEWYYRLSQIQGASGLITDVFNASGSTFKTIYSLLCHLGIPCAGYFPFIDRDDFQSKPKKYNVQRFGLYSWYGPREQKNAIGAERSGDA